MPAEFIFQTLNSKVEHRSEKHKNSRATEATKLAHFGKAHLTTLHWLTFALFFPFWGCMSGWEMPFCIYVVKVFVQYLVFIGFDLIKYFHFSARIFTSVPKTIAFWSFFLWWSFWFEFFLNKHAFSKLGWTRIYDLGKRKEEEKRKNIMQVFKHTQLWPGFPNICSSFICGFKNFYLFILICKLQFMPTVLVLPCICVVSVLMGLWSCLKSWCFGSLECDSLE